MPPPPTCHPSVPGNRVPKVLDLEGALESACEESPEGSNERGKEGDDDRVELEGKHGRPAVGREGRDRCLEASRR